MQHTAGDVESSLHSAGQSFCQRTRSILQRSPFKNFANAMFQGLATDAFQPSEDLQVLLNGQIRIDGKVLRNEAQPNRTAIISIIKRVSDDLAGIRLQ